MPEVKIIVEMTYHVDPEEDKYAFLGEEASLETCVDYDMEALDIEDISFSEFKETIATNVTYRYEVISE